MPLRPWGVADARQKWNSNKIMRVLNAFYQYMSERDGKEPMPIEVFKERKKVINELSKNREQWIHYKTVILGAALGYEAIPQFFKDDLEMHDLILHMADDLYRGEVTKME